jgi:hypothetical protein
MQSDVNDMGRVLVCNVCSKYIVMSVGQLLCGSLHVLRGGVV